MKIAGESTAKVQIWPQHSLHKVHGANERVILTEEQHMRSRNIDGHPLAEVIEQRSLQSLSIPALPKEIIEKAHFLVRLAGNRPIPISMRPFGTNTTVTDIIRKVRATPLPTAAPTAPAK